MRYHVSRPSSSSSRQVQKHDLIVKSIPLLFVVLWATGFVGAKFGLEYAEPLTLLLIRMLSNVAVFLTLVWFLKSRRLSRSEIVHSIVVGILVHAIYLGGVFVAIASGMPAGISSLLVGAQPILTACLAWWWMGNRLQLRQIAGMLLGTLGVFVVVYLGGRIPGRMDFGWGALVLCFASLAGIAVGTLYQKRYCRDVDLVSGTLYQYFGASLFLLAPAWALEGMEVVWSMPLVLVLAWMVLALSTVAVLLLMLDRKSVV